MIHLGPIAAGRQVSKDDQLRQDFATRFGILAFDTEYDAVIESVFGNRKDCYTIVRGISDYKDGTRKKEWQPYASLAAAAFTKALICSMPASVDDWVVRQRAFLFFPLSPLSLFATVNQSFKIWRGFWGWADDRCGPGASYVYFAVEKC